MSYKFTSKVSKKEAADVWLYTLLNSEDKVRPEWNRELTYFNTVSIDPATNNFAMRINRRYHDGKILPIAWVKESFKITDPKEINLKYKRIVDFLEKYSEVFQNCHYLIIERQLHVNYVALRISQTVITYFLRFPQIVIVEVDAKLKTKMLNAPKKMNANQVKVWAIDECKKIIDARGDQWSIQRFDWKPKGKKEKKDDLADTVVQEEALFKLWGFPITVY